MQINTERKYNVLVIAFLGIFIGFIFGNYTAGYDIPIISQIKGSQQVINKEPPQELKNVDFGLFWKTWKKLEEKYVDKSKIDYQKMVYGATRGMVSSVDDPYTVFMDPTETENFNSDLSGTFEGIGAELGIKDDILTIIAPLKDTPAEKAGLKAGDKILKINDTLSNDLSIDQAVKMIRGKKGTAVKLTIMHKDEDEPREISVVRDVINVKSVELEFKDNIAWLKISRFDDSTAEEVNKAADQIIVNGAKGIVVDLRNNPGGYLQSAIDVAGTFLPNDSLVVMEDTNSGDMAKSYTKGNARLEKISTVVLINEGSASAAEILAGALRDNRKIKLIGEKSFGKGSVQEMINLNGSSDSNLKVTIAYWLTPSGVNINKEGIKPDIEKKITKEDLDNERDPQLDEALKELNNL